MDTPFTIVMYRTFHAQRNAIRPGMADIGLSPGQPKILHYLLNHDGCMQRELADACDIEPATVSRLLDKMEEDGLVRREIPPKRTRACCVSLTNWGREAHALWHRLCLETENHALQGFDDEEQTKFREYLNRMYGNLTGKSLN